MGPIPSSGSGVIISDRRVLTAAHVVADQVMVEVRRAGDSRRYTAEVDHVCHVCDLAVLKVADAAFYEGSRALEIGRLPGLQQAVEVHGFPKGGSGLAITSGIVSRIAVDYYVHSLTALLLVQVDAAVNAGNSGGPAISNGKIVGIAMQMLEEAENIGYIVPAPIIRHFLKDIEDDRFDGFPELGVWVQSLHNSALRSSLGLQQTGGGVLVSAVSTTGGASQVLEAGDVLLTIAGVAIGSDNAIDLGEGVRVDATVLEHRAQVGEEVEVTFLREGVLHSEKIRMALPDPLVPLGPHDQDIPFRIYGGLVFQQLTERYLTIFEEAPSRLMTYASYPSEGGHRLLVSDRGVDGRREVVVLSGVLATELTRGYENMEDEVVLAVDGTTVRDLRHLSELLDSAPGEFLTITTEQGHMIVLDRAEVASANEEILSQYRIASDRSPGLAVPAKQK
jgi:S1-C subfamily serine protease